MATSLLALIDDIATLLDDVATLTKVAAKKTAGVLGDDLALNAQQVTGVSASREIPVVLAVAKGSAINKLILVPAALAISAFAPWAILPLLMLGGAYLCFEGAEKIMHKLLHRHQPEQAAHETELRKALTDPSVDLMALERNKVKGAIRTDFILSAEIIVISLGTVSEATFPQRLGVLAGVSAIMTIGVYGLVALIVKLDDIGLSLTRMDREGLKSFGRGILWSAPRLMRGLGIAGTIAMFLVGGGILAHGIPPLHHLSEAIHHWGGIAGTVLPILLDGLTGVVAGAILVGVVTLVQRARGAPETH